MNSRNRYICLLFGLCAVFSFTSALGFDFSELEKAVSETTLDNGLKVIVMERHDAPVVSCVTFANVGGANDPADYTGIAHMLEHMAFKGTTTIGTTDIEAELAAMAVEDSVLMLIRAEKAKGKKTDPTRLEALEAEFEAAKENARQYMKVNAWDGLLEEEGAVGINAGTGKDNTTYIMSLPSNKIELWMYMESERFKNLVLRSMYQEQLVIAEERRQQFENNPIMRTLGMLQATAFEAHPYGVPVVGHMSDIMNYTRPAVRKYFEENYVPRNLVVAIVGDVDAKKVLKMADKYFGRLEDRPKPEPIATVEPEQEGERFASLEDPSQPLLVAGYHIPSSTDPDWPAVTTMMSYLGDGRTSPLYENLVKEKKIASAVGCQWWPGSAYPCLCMFYAIPSPESTNDECHEQILTEIERLKTEPLAPEAIDKIKAQAKAGFINGLRSNLGLAQQLASFQNYWGDWREAFKEIDRINAVTPEEVQRVANKYLVKNNRTVVQLNTTEN